MVGVKDCQKCIYHLKHLEYRPDESWQDMAKYKESLWQSWLKSEEAEGCVFCENCHGAKWRGVEK